MKGIQIEPKIIFSQRYMNIYLRIFVANSIPIIFLMTIILLFIQMPLISIIVMAFIGALFSLVRSLHEYKYFLYKVELQNSNLKLYFTKWNKKYEIICDLKTIIISFNIQKTFKLNDNKLTIMKNKKEIIIEVMPEAGWFSITRKNKIKALYETLINLQNELLNDLELEHL